MTGALGLDVGGTTIKGGVVDVSTGAVLAEGSEPFAKDVPAAEIWARAAQLVHRLEAAVDARFDTVGVGCAGLFDRRSGRVLASANMPNTERYEGVTPRRIWPSNAPMTPKGMASMTKIG